MHYKPYGVAQKQTPSWALNYWQRHHMGSLLCDAAAVSRHSTYPRTSRQSLLSVMHNLPLNEHRYFTMVFACALLCASHTLHSFSIKCVLRRSSVQAISLHCNYNSSLCGERHLAVTPVRDHACAIWSLYSKLWRTAPYENPWRIAPHHWSGSV